ncbi:MAG: lytic transglycosylase domain-containing protein [Ruminococcus sp.]
MAANPRYRKKQKKKGHGVIVGGCIVLSAVLLALFVFNYYDTAKQQLLELSYPRDYSRYVEKAAEEYELEPSLIYAVIRTESGFNPDAESGAGACGIMQVMPSSFEWLQQIRDCEGIYTEEDLFNPEICIDYGSYLLRYFLDFYGTETSAVAAYNAGFVVSDWLADPSYSTDGVTLSDIPYPETKEYVNRVTDAKAKYIELYYS